MNLGNKSRMTFRDVRLSLCSRVCFYLQGEIPWLDKGSSYLENCKTSSPPRHHLLLPKYLFLLGYGPPRWTYFEKMIVTHYTCFKLTSCNCPSSCSRRNYRTLSAQLSDLFLTCMTSSSRTPQPPAVIFLPFYWTPYLQSQLEGTLFLIPTFILLGLLFLYLPSFYGPHHFSVILLITLFLSLPSIDSNMVTLPRILYSLGLSLHLSPPSLGGLTENPVGSSINTPT